MNRKLMRIFIVALTVNLVISKSVPSDDAETGLQDEKFPEGPAEESKAVLVKQMQYIKGILQGFKEKAEPEIQKFAEKSKPIVDALSGWLSDKWQKTIDAGKQGMKHIKAFGQDTADVILAKYPELAKPQYF